MSDIYYFNNHVDQNGNHEVHTLSCQYLPKEDNRTYIGLCSNCSTAIETAKKQYPSEKFDGCFWCCRPCHKG